MKDMENKPSNQDSELFEPKGKPGLFSRFIDKLDRKLKDKADQSGKNSCCGGDNQGGKCC
jgi:hypothetical protein